MTFDLKTKDMTPPTEENMSHHIHTGFVDQ